MDLQALTFVKLAEHQPVAFDPGKEDDYYDSAVALPWFVGAICRSISRTIKWLQAIRASGQRPPERLGKLGATTQ